MRPGARLASPEGCDVHDHLSWVFEDDADFAAAARTFLDEGAARGERLVYGAARPVGELAAELAGVCSAGAALATALGYDEPVPGEFVLDVSGVRFIDGRGLAALGERADRLAEAGGTLVVEGASPVVARLSDLCGLADHPSARLRRAAPA